MAGDSRYNSATQETYEIYPPWWASYKATFLTKASYYSDITVYQM